MSNQPILRVVLAGASGFLGRPLAASLAGEGHRVVVLTRDAARAGTSAGRIVPWTPDGSATGSWVDEIDGADAVINLSGEPIEAHRWTAAHKQRIRNSRVLATRSIVSALARTNRDPVLFINASASGYYGPQGDDVVTEDTPPGSDFLARVCLEWEMEAARAAGPRTRVVCLRTGIVLGRDGGALPKMLPPFWFGVGGPVGSGRQYWPWIHLQDWIDLVRFAISTPSVSGPVNASAPNPVRNREFARALGGVLRRPSFMTVPGFALKLLLGEMAEPLLLSGQRMVPAKAERLGFVFSFTQVDSALLNILKNRPHRR